MTSGSRAPRLDPVVLEHLGQRRRPLELQLPQRVEHLTTERLPSSLELLEQSPVDVALTRIVGDQVPQLADLRLPAPEALLQPVRVPRQVVVHHQVGPLQVDALAGRVGGQQ